MLLNKCGSLKNLRFGLRGCFFFELLLLVSLFVYLHVCGNVCQHLDADNKSQQIISSNFRAEKNPPD